MKNLSIFDYINSKVEITKKESDELNNDFKVLLIEMDKVLLYNDTHLYNYTKFTNKIVHWYESKYKINKILMDELLNTFYIVSDTVIIAVSYEFIKQNERCTDIYKFELTKISNEDDLIFDSALSPNKEYLIIVTKSNMLITLSSTLDVIKQQEFMKSDVKGEKESVNVGWGKVETQFHGSTKSTIQSIANTAEFVDMGPTKIVWREDSTLYAINYYNPNTNTRMIKVYSEENTLQYTSKPIAGLENHLSWRPHVMAHLASTQRLPNKYVVLFIEKNTEIKDMFELKNIDSVKQLKWNSDGSLLTVITFDHQIFLYSNSNWHWYLKQHIKYNNTLSLEWRSNMECSIYNNKTLHTFQWKFNVDQNNSSVFVIDANELLITNFNKSFIPPPMCQVKLQSATNISKVLYLEDNDMDCISLVSSDGLVTIYKNMILESKTINIANYHKIIWLRYDCFVYINNNDEIYSISLDGETKLLTSVSSRIINILKKNSNEFILQLSNLNVVLYTMESDTPIHLFTLPEPCPHMSFAHDHFIFMSAQCRLYDNGELCWSDVTSCLTYKDWLIISTSSHNIVIFKLKPGQKIDQSNGVSRRVERGTRIVTVNQNCNLILQMPRGNLETITPRALILDLLCNLLDEKKYKEAFTEMRKHRIDLNLLVDHVSPDYKQLVLQVTDPLWLSCLVADLKSEDVTRLQSFYAEFYSKFTEKRDILNKGKNIEDICKNLSKVMEAVDRNKYLQVIMHCYVKSGNMAQALELAKLSSAALDFLILLHDVNGLYDTALQMYDLDLALLIAGKSQKDPKEYVSYLNQLRSMESYKMKFEIDKKFNKYLSAVKNVALESTNEEEIEECLNIIRKHKLWAQVLEFFPKTSTHCKTILHEYGFQLELKGRHEEAAIYYEKALSFEDTIRSFTKAGSWRCAIALARKQNYELEMLDKLYTDLTRSLESRRDYNSLVQMAEMRGAEFIPSVVKDCMRENYTLGLELVYQYSLEHLIENDIKPVLEETFNDTKEEISNAEKQFINHFERLQLVRSLPKPVSNTMGGDDDMSDWGSETGSSIVSSRSGMTGTSTSSRGRRKRKQERKLWSLREGNPREEISLIKALSDDIQLIESMTGRTRSLCQSLLKLELNEEARVLQTQLKAVLNYIDNQRDKIWIPPLDDQISFDDARVNLPPSSNVVHNWELESFKKV